MIHLLLIDDHPVVRAGYRLLLEQDGSMQVVQQADHAHQALTLLGELSVDVVVTDVTMPQGDVWSLLRGIASLVTKPRVVVASMHNDPLLVQRCLHAGAQAFVTKNAPPHTLIDAIHSVLQGRRFVSDDVAELANEQKMQWQGIESLTERERHVWRMLALGQSAAQCAQALQLSSKTVANYQSLIKEKLQVDTVGGLVRLAQQYQWLLQA